MIKSKLSLLLFSIALSLFTTAICSYSQPPDFDSLIKEFANAKGGEESPVYKISQYEESYDALIKALSNPNPLIRANVILALGWKNNPASFEPIENTLNDADVRVVKNACQVLARLDYNRIENRLIDLLENNNPEVRLEAAKILSEHYNPICKSTLENLLVTNNKNIQYGAIVALGNVGDVHSIELIINNTAKSTKEIFPLNYINCFTKIAGKDSRKYIMQLVKKGISINESVFDADDIDELIKLSKSSDFNVKKASMIALSLIVKDRIFSNEYDYLNRLTYREPTYAERIKIKDAIKGFPQKNNVMRRLTFVKPVLSTKSINLSIKNLKSKNSDLIVDALEFLSYTIVPNKYNLFLPLLSHQDSNVRIAVIKYFDKTGYPDVLNIFRNSLNDKNAEVRVEVAKSLGNRYIADGLQVLLDDLKEKNTEEIALILCKITNPNAYQAIIKYIQETKNSNVLERIASSANPIYADLYLEILKEKDDTLIATSVKGLALLNDKRVLPVIAKILDTREVYFAQPLVLMGDDGVDFLIDSYKGKSIPYKQNVISALSEKVSDKIFSELKKLSSNSELSIQYEIIKGLGKYKSNEAVDTIKYVISNHSSAISYQAMDSLVSIGTQYAIDTIVGLINNERKDVKINAIRGLANLKDEKALPEIKKMLDSENSDDVRIAFDFLINFPDSISSSEIKRILAKPRVPFIEDAVRVLAMKKNPEDIDYIIDYLNQQYPSLNHFQFIFIDYYPNSKLKESWFKKSNSRNKTLRICILEMLARKGYLPAIDTLLNDKNIISNDKVRVYKYAAETGLSKYEPLMRSLINSETEIALEYFANIGTDKNLNFAEDVITGINTNGGSLKVNVADSLRKFDYTKSVKRLIVNSLESKDFQLLAGLNESIIEFGIENSEETLIQMMYEEPDIASWYSLLNSQNKKLVDAAKRYISFFPEVTEWGNYSTDQKASIWGARASEWKN